MFTKQTLNITGIHCRSCKILIEGEIKNLPGIKSIDVDHRSGQCRLEFDDSKISREKILKTIEELNYGIADGKTAPKAGKSIPKKLIIAGAMLALFAFGYWLVGYFGLLELLAQLNEPKIGYGLIFFIGILTSFHCVGMCGGLVVTYTARHAASQNKGRNNFSPHMQYNAGRIISYAFIGGILGGVGSFFGINPDFTGTIILLAGGFMVLMGLSLLTNFRWLEKLKLRTPDFIARFLYSEKHNRKPKGPFIIGLANGFMPCGPLQAIQLYALASGSMTRGALSMGIFALGTVPLMFGFGSFLSLISRERIGQIMKLSGVIVIILGLLMANRGLTALGYGAKTFLPRQAVSQPPARENGGESAQIVRMNVTYTGYQPNVLYVKKGIPVKWMISGSYATGMSGCTNEIILQDYNIRKKLTDGETVIEFTPGKTGEIKFSCGMRMVWGKFIVTDDLSGPVSNTANAAAADAPAPAAVCSSGSGGTCGGQGCSCGCGGNAN